MVVGVPLIILCVVCTLRYDRINLFLHFANDKKVTADKEKKGYPNKAASARKRLKRFSGAWIIMLVLQFRIASNFLGISTHIYYTKTGKKAPNTSNFSQKEEKYVRPSITVGEKKLLPFLYELRRSEDKQMKNTKRLLRAF